MNARTALTAAVALAIVAFAVTTTGGASPDASPTPPYLTQVKPVWGDVFIHQPSGSRKLTYRGDYVLAIFDYDRLNGNRAIKVLAYTVCHTVTRRTCVRRTWRGRPDVLMVYVSPDARRAIDFTWHVAGVTRADRIWVFE